MSAYAQHMLRIYSTHEVSSELNVSREQRNASHTKYAPWITFNLPDCKANLWIANILNTKSGILKSSTAQVSLVTVKHLDFYVHKFNEKPTQYRIVFVLCHFFSKPLVLCFYKTKEDTIRTLIALRLILSHIRIQLEDILSYGTEKINTCKSTIERVHSHLTWQKTAAEVYNVSPRSNRVFSSYIPNFTKAEKLALNIRGKTMALIDLFDNFFAIKQDLKTMIHSCNAVSMLTNSKLQFDTISESFVLTEKQLMLDHRTWNNRQTATSIGIKRKGEPNSSTQNSV